MVVFGTGLMKRHGASVSAQQSGHNGGAASAPEIKEA